MLPWWWRRERRTDGTLHLHTAPSLAPQTPQSEREGCDSFSLKAEKQKMQVYKLKQPLRRQTGTPTLSNRNYQCLKSLVWLNKHRGVSWFHRERLATKCKCTRLDKQPKQKDKINSREAQITSHRGWTPSMSPPYLISTISYLHRK